MGEVAPSFILGYLYKTAVAIEEKSLASLEDAELFSTLGREEYELNVLVRALGDLIDTNNLLDGKTQRRHTHIQRYAYVLARWHGDTHKIRKKNEKSRA